MKDQFWVLTCESDDDDVTWIGCTTFVGPPQMIAKMTLKGFLPGWRLLKGQAAQRFLEKPSFKEELRKHRVYALQKNAANN